MMSLNGELPEEDGSESNTNSSDELEAFSNLTSGDYVEEQIGLAKQELLASMKEYPPNTERASASVPRRLKLKFRNRVSLPVFTGVPLLGENQTPIEIALVDVLTEQIINIGTESTAKLEIMGFRVGDDDDYSWTFEEFQERIMSERQGRRILQGNTC
ncbi:hypothetical protein L1987_44881 [Smallanthus sonchifolius]|uniref:Uncharacterized protein n=1 Tax=Smallanthus sonchifolius TaxID=185202 RepID=A0ACB9GRV0_9ASTR|nr:hypothetical protein L1987_44881 [Smallanthus sonchifolius]